MSDINDSIDLTNLHEMTGNDAALEKELFDIFLSSGAESIAAMRSSYQPEAAEQWRKAAHALKGTSLNLGAERLGKLCKEGQDNADASPEQKQQMLAAIEAEYARVEAFLQNI